MIKLNDLSSGLTLILNDESKSVHGGKGPIAGYGGYGEPIPSPFIPGKPSTDYGGYHGDRIPSPFIPSDPIADPGWFIPSPLIPGEPL